jgi:CubicO group peptidase (beta-lactamase class C family)
MAGHVAAGHLPGLVTLVACGDDVHIDTIGTPSFADDAPLARDAIFRIASLSKPITAVATMSLVEEGVLRLEEPIDELVPELADRRVLRAIDAELDDTVPANRPITLEDLLSYRFGFGSVLAPPGSYPIQRAEAQLGLRSIGGPPWPPVDHDVDGWIGALGSLPLMCQPGEQWLYNTSAQVLGVLLARACGQDLESVLRERIFEPLGMVDTGFTVPTDQLGRLTTATGPIVRPVSCRFSTMSPTAGGAHRRRSRMQAGGSSPRSTTTGRSSRWCWREAPGRANASSRRRRSPS